MRRGLFICLLAGVLAGGCQTVETEVQPAFYHWKTVLELSPAEEVYLDSLGAGRLYVKFFDVAWAEEQGMAVPHATLEVQPGQWEKRSIVPCVFITNEVFERTPEGQIAELAKKVVERIQRVSAHLPGADIREVQIDCDWTESTRAAYFRFLEVLLRFLDKAEIRLSATIRLHQIRYYQRTGVPPVDRGMLMFYNVGDLRDWEEPNSILRVENALPYLNGFDRYPLPLDLALPAFAWGVIFRDGRMIRLINNLRGAQLSDTSRFVKLAPGRFEVVKSTYLNGYYLYRGDRIRTEAVDAELLRESARLLAPHFRRRTFTTAFYHLDSSIIKHLAYEQLEEVITILENS